MLVKLTDLKGVEVWVNPVHVKMVKDTRKGAHVLITGSTGFDSGVSIKTRTPANEVVELLNAAMPDIAGYVPEDEAASSAGATAAASLLG